MAIIARLFRRMQLDFAPLSELGMTVTGLMLSNFRSASYIAPVFRGDASRAVVRSAVLPLVVLLEQTAKPVARISIKLEGFRCSFRVHCVWVDAATTRGERGFQSNNSRGFGIIFPRGRVITAQLVHQLGCFVLQRTDAPRLAIVQSCSPNLPTREHEQRRQW